MSKPQDRLRSSEMKYRSLFENVPAGIFRSTPDGRILSANDALVRMLGYDSQSEMRALNAKDLFWDSQEREKHITTLQNEGALRGVEMALRRKDGQQIFVLANARGIRNKKGELLYQEGTIVDITESKKIEEQLKASELKYRSLFENVPDGVYQSSAGGKILTANVALVRMLGFQSKEELMAADIKDLYVHQTERKKWIRKLEEKGELHNAELVLRRKDGREVIVLENSRPVYDDKGELLYFEGTLTDITERKRIEQIKDDLISIVSHELRTPLTAILGSLSYLLNKQDQLPEQIRGFLEVANRSGQRMLRLINDLLDLDKIESGKMDFTLEPVEVMPLVEQALEVNRDYAAQFGVQFKLERGTRNIKTKTDTDRFIQVMTNLLSNAAKFSPSQETVGVSVSRRGASVRVAIRDRGPGIPTEFHASLFEKFAQATTTMSHSSKGTGLGLSISKAIVEKLGGRIGFETEPGVGTTFYFNLPEFKE